MENQQPPRSELLAAVLEDAGAVEDLPVGGCGPVGVGSVLQLQQRRKFSRLPRVSPANMASAACLLTVNLLTVGTGLDVAFVLQHFVNSDQVEVGVS